MDGTDGLIDQLKHLVLPTMVLAMIPGAFIVRVTRAAVLETLGKDFIRTAARSERGGGNAPVLYRHALRAALVR